MLLRSRIENRVKQSNEMVTAIARATIMTIPPPNTQNNALH